MTYAVVSFTLLVAGCTLGLFAVAVGATMHNRRTVALGLTAITLALLGYYLGRLP